MHWGRQGNKSFNEEYWTNLNLNFDKINAMKGSEKNMDFKIV